MSFMESGSIPLLRAKGAEKQARGAAEKSVRVSICAAKSNAEIAG